MKLRIRGDSIRLRLTRSDTAALIDRGVVEEQTRFTREQRFIYRLVSDARSTQPRAAVEDGVFVVRVPGQLVERWASSQDVGIEAWQGNGSEDGLRILIEKDFPCLTARAHEDDSDAFVRKTGD